MMQFVCVKWGDKYSAEDVKKLHRSISKYLTLPHVFTCFTEDPTGLECDTRPFIEKLDGWWNKVSLFAEQDYCSDRIAYLDLDVVVCGNIDHIFSHTAPFLSLKDRVWKGINSSFMLWDHKAHIYVHERFNPEIRHRCGDQGYIGETVKSVAYANDLFPNQIVSYKLELSEKQDQRIVYFHGKPKAADAEGWVKQHWITNTSVTKTS